MSVSRETDIKLRHYQSLIERWSKRINLVSKSTVTGIWERHIEDCVQLTEFAEIGDAWCDLGSGAGLPGLVVAILRPDVSITLIESDQRKAVFLRHVRHELDLRCEVISSRIELTNPIGADVVSARALASLNELLALAARHGSANTRYVFPKGRRYREEVEEARANWSFDIDVYPNKIEKDGVVLILENIERV